MLLLFTRFLLETWYRDVQSQHLELGIRQVQSMYVNERKSPKHGSCAQILTNWRKFVIRSRCICEKQRKQHVCASVLCYKWQTILFVDVYISLAIYMCVMFRSKMRALFIFNAFTDNVFGNALYHSLIVNILI